MIRKQVYYAGRVQGVGFRYTATRTAGGYPVTGFVKNLHDGQVEVVVEGEAGAVYAFLQDLEARMSRNIRNTQRMDLAATGEFVSFEVRY